MSFGAFNFHTLRALLSWTMFAALITTTQAHSDRSITTQTPRLQAPEYQSLQSGTVTRVLDQNTILVEIDGKATRIDLLGVSGATTPQHRNQSSAAIETLSMLTLGEIVRIQYDPNGETNRSNKRVAYLYRAPDNLFVNLELIRQGQSRFTKNSMSIHIPIFEHYEQRAKQLMRGIWEPGKPLPPQETPEEKAPTPSVDKSPSQIPGTIYITRHGTKYHLKDCPHLTDSTRPTTRDKIESTHQPCKTCTPDTP